MRVSQRWVSIFTRRTDQVTVARASSCWGRPIIICKSCMSYRIFAGCEPLHSIAPIYTCLARVSYGDNSSLHSKYWSVRVTWATTCLVGVSHGTYWRWFKRTCELGTILALRSILQLTQDCVPGSCLLCHDLVVYFNCGRSRSKPPASWLCRRLLWCLFQFWYQVPGTSSSIFRWRCLAFVTLDQPTIDIAWHNSIWLDYSRQFMSHADAVAAASRSQKARRRQPLWQPEVG